MDLVTTVTRGMWGIVSANLPHTIVFMLLFTLLGAVAKTCNAKEGPWYRKPDLAVDVLYWFIGPMLGTVFFTALLSLVVMGLRTATPDMAHDYLATGIGPLSRLGFWPQVAVYLVLSDLILYATHRWFHGAALWRFHAIHHGTEHLDWISAARFHPANILFNTPFANAVLILAGISPEVVVAVAPFNLFMGALVHANLDWTFGRFGLLIASPVFHRWHHTAPDRGGSSNFAPTFPLIDIAFGTYFMPKGELPDEYGVDDPEFPPGLLQQMTYPWQRPAASPKVTDCEPDQKGTGR